ncbi:uncharacterized protein LOC130737530 isoform X2 [Lotus japonicus]|uniref:uncharacterized protein LOC130737530 isoform X2 n=1 Tax=Lotus japonicus TaxID=34305 RepID=UPI0025826381|nr:uncharacterized protein LOC130737530 isoform X2 [Lotus japonicus]
MREHAYISSHSNHKEDIMIEEKKSRMKKEVAEKKSKLKDENVVEEKRSKRKNKEDNKRRPTCCENPTPAKKAKKTKKGESAFEEGDETIEKRSPDKEESVVEKVNYKVKKEEADKKSNLTEENLVEGKRSKTKSKSDKKKQLLQLVKPSCCEKPTLAKKAKKTRRGLSAAEERDGTFEKRSPDKEDHVIEEMQSRMKKERGEKKSNHKEESLVEVKSSKTKSKGDADENKQMLQLEKPTLAKKAKKIRRGFEVRDKTFEKRTPEKEEHVIEEIKSMEKKERAEKESILKEESIVEEKISKRKSKGAVKTKQVLQLERTSYYEKPTKKAKRGLSASEEWDNKENVLEEINSKMEKEEVDKNSKVKEESLVQEKSSKRKNKVAGEKKQKLQLERPSYCEKPTPTKKARKTKRGLSASEERDEDFEKIISGKEDNVIEEMKSKMKTKEEHMIHEKKSMMEKEGANKKPNIKEETVVEEKSSKKRKKKGEEEEKKFLQLKKPSCSEKHPPTKKVRKPPIRFSASEKRNEAYKKRTADNTWVPPRSHIHLIQEDHAFDPWRVLAICMLLNLTTGRQVKEVISNFFKLCPDAETCTQVSEDEILEVIRSLGLHKRAAMLQRFSREYLAENWTHVTQLHGVGKYVMSCSSNCVYNGMGLMHMPYFVRENGIE